MDVRVAGVPSELHAFFPPDPSDLLYVGFEAIHDPSTGTI